MDNEFLKAFLKTGLFEIGDSDDRLEKLRKSIAELQKNFEEDYSLLPKYTLVAIDPTISVDEPALLETETIVTKYWETLRSKYPEMPRNILRGVILNAINNVGISDPIAARIIYLTALNLYPYVKLNKEKETVKSLLQELGDIAEEDAIKEWSFVEEEPSLKLPTLKIASLQFGDIKLDKEKLLPNLRAAMTNSPSGHNTQHGGTSTWGEHFVTNTAKGIESSFNDALKEFNQSFNQSSLESPINKFFTAFKKSLDNNLKSAFTSLTSVERRSKLLWWKESLYSSSLKKSYRELESSSLPIVMGVDLNSLIPEVTPISVDYLLRDTIFLLKEKKDTPVTFGDFIKDISQKSLKEKLKGFFLELNEEKGRISITDFIGLLLNDRVTVNELQNRTGIKEKDVSSLGELAVTMLHDLLTKRLISN